MYYIGPELQIDIDSISWSLSYELEEGSNENDTGDDYDDNDDIQWSSPMSLPAHHNDDNQFVHVSHENHGDNFYQSALSEFKAMLAQADRLPGACSLVWSAVTTEL